MRPLSSIDLCRSDRYASQFRRARTPYLEPPEDGIRRWFSCSAATENRAQQKSRATALGGHWPRLGQAATATRSIDHRMAQSARSAPTPADSPTAARGVWGEATRRRCVRPVSRAPRALPSEELGEVASKTNPVRVSDPLFPKFDLRKPGVAGVAGRHRAPRNAPRQTALGWDGAAFGSWGGRGSTRSMQAPS